MNRLLDTRSSPALTPLQSVSDERSRTLRASDDDRQRVLQLLQHHYVAGRLDAHDLEERTERALAARTLADLDVLLADLPSIPSSSGQSRSERRRSRHAHSHFDSEAFSRGGPCERRGFAAHAISYGLVMVLLAAIWLLTTPGGYFWPIWPMLGWGIGLASHGLATRRLALAGGE